MLLKKSLIGLLCCVVVGCSNQTTPVEPDTQNQSEIPADVQQQSLEVKYIAGESLDDMLVHYQALLASGVISELSPADKQEMIDALLAYTKQQTSLAAAGQTVTAYAAYYFWSGNDTDLKLEYKWWAGSRQRYYMSTPNWALYWAIRACYGGSIDNWTWMEGGYQRVSAVVGSCLYVPFGSGYIRYYLRVSTY